MPVSSTAHASRNDLESVGSCPLCGAAEHFLLYSFPPFEVVRCGRCSLGYLSPRLTWKAMAAFYEDPGYFEGSAGCGYDDYAHQEPGLRRTFARFLGRLEKRGLTGGSLLEVGCGPGFLLDEAREYFSRRVGTEFSPETAERARGFSDEVVVGGVDALDKGEVFNLVVAVSVLEHVYEPVGFLALMEKHLDTGGAVVLVTPDLDGFWRKGFGSRWPSFKVPEHVTYFNRRTLRQLGRESGLDQVDFWGFTQVFPVSLVLEKLGLKLTSGVLRNSLLPIPFTMLCAVFKRQ